jgi:glycine/D-amino acid oxidase-like deaminating enzyme
VVLPTPGARLVDIRDARGLRAARAIWDASRRAALEWMALVRRTRLRCALASADYVQAAATVDEAARLEREYAALKEAGFEAAWLPARRARHALGTDAEAALKLAGAGVFDPYRACIGVARLAASAGALLCEETELSRVKVRRHGVEVTTTGGTVSASAVVFATRTPTPGLRALDRHFWTQERYIVALPEMTAAQQKRLGFAHLVAEDLATPPHTWRWTANGALLFAGAAQRPVPSRLHDRTLVQRTGQLMYELSLHYPQVSGTPAASGWSVPVTTAGDGLPIIGVHRGFPRHLFALGFGGTGVSGAWLAARMIARRWSEAAEREDDLFGFGR